MSNFDEGRLRAWLDGELAPGEGLELQARFHQDPHMVRAAEDIRAREARVGSLLSTLDVTPPVERVRRALETARSGSRNEDLAPYRADPRSRVAVSRASGARLAQAATLVLFLAGAASAAIPGSPVRAWLDRALGSGPEPAAIVPGLAEEPVPEEGGLYVAPGRDRLDVDLVGVPSATEIVVTLVPGDTAVVYAPEGSEYEWDAELGRARANVSGGPVRLELPDGVDVDLIVDDRVYMSRRGGRTDFRVTPTFESESEFRFRSGG